MPFRSEKQRKYLWMKHPEIARRWTEEHGSEIKQVAKKRLQKGKRKGHGNSSQSSK